MAILKKNLPRAYPGGETKYVLLNAVIIWP